MWGGCSSDSGDETSPNDGTTATLTSVTISGTAEISAAGSTTLEATAIPASISSSSVNYNWEIEDGANYVELSASGNKATVKGNNSTSSKQTAKIKVTATYNGTSKSATIEISVAAKSDSGSSDDNPSEEKITITFLDSNKTVQTITSPKSDSGYTLTDSNLRKLTKDGYNFLGWTLSKDSTALVEAGTTIFENTTLYALWETITYKITYELGSGVSWADGYEAASTYTVEDEITLPQATNLSNSNTGSTFIGWKDSSGETVSSISKGTMGNLTFTANWEATLYGIEYSNIEDAEFVNYTLRYGFTTSDTVIVLPTKDEIVKNGYEFLYWWDDGYNKVTQLTSNSANNNKYVLLIALWSLKDYKIKYEENGATTHLSNPVSSYNIENDAITLPANIAKTGYTFGGWYESSDFEGEAATEIPTGSYGDKTFYAKWIPGESSYKVEHWLQRESLKGYDLDTSETKTGTTEALTEAEPKTYTGFTVKEDYSQKTIKGDGSTVVSLYYDRKTVKITLNAGDGTFRSNQKNTIEISGAYGAIFDEGYEEPVRDGYAFKEWNPKISDYTFPIEDATYEAVWTENRIASITVSAPEYSSDKTGFLSIDSSNSPKIKFTATEGETYKWFVFSPGIGGLNVKSPRSTKQTFETTFYTSGYYTIMLVIDDKYSATTQIKIVNN